MLCRPLKEVRLEVSAQGLEPCGSELGLELRLRGSPIPDTAETSAAPRPCPRPPQIKTIRMSPAAVESVREPERLRLSRECRRDAR